MEHQYRVLRLVLIASRPTFIQIFKKKSVEQFKPDPYLATTMNCMLWVFYGLPFVHPKSILVVTTNGIGLSIEILYLIIFFTYADKKGRVSDFTFQLLDLDLLMSYDSSFVFFFSHAPSSKFLISQLPELPGQQISGHLGN